MEANNDPKGYQTEDQCGAAMADKLNAARRTADIASGLGTFNFVIVDLDGGERPDEANPHGLKNKLYLGYLKYLRHTINTFQDIFVDASDQEVLVMAQDTLSGFTEEYGTAAGAAN